jgi:hypothetical protein
MSPPFDLEERLHDPCNDIIEILGSLVTISLERVSRNTSHQYSDFELDVTPIDPGSDVTDLAGKEIKLAHFSVKEYLLSDRTGISSASGFRATSVEADQLISESCLLYILHYDESDSKTTTPEDLECFPLLQYACKFWVNPRNSDPREKPKIGRSCDLQVISFGYSVIGLAANPSPPYAIKRAVQYLGRGRLTVALRCMDWLGGGSTAAARAWGGYRRKRSR